MASESKGLVGDAQDVWALVLAYLKQETLEPIRGLGRFVALGFIGAVALGIGTVLLVLAGLRALQTETGERLTGSWSWAPYAVTLLACVVVAGIAASRIGKGPAKKQRVAIEQRKKQEKERR